MQKGNDEDKKISRMRWQFSTTFTLEAVKLTIFKECIQQSLIGYRPKIKWSKAPQDSAAQWKGLGHLKSHPDT